MEVETGIQLLSTADKLGIVGVLFSVIALSAIFNYWLIKHTLENCRNMQKIENPIETMANLLKSNHSLQEHTIDLLKSFNDKENNILKELINDKITSHYNELASDLNRLIFSVENINNELKALHTEIELRNKDESE